MHPSSASPIRRGHRCGRRRAAGFAIAALVAIIPGSANAGGFDLACESTSTLVKGGVYSPDAEGAPDGIFGGVEHAARIAPTFEMGAALDYFYRRRSSPPHLFEDDGHPYDIPIEGEASEFASSTHLASLGLNGRLLLPLGDRGPSPFVEAGLALQVLHLRARDEGGRSDRIQSDTFGGIGWHVGAGVEQPLGHSVSLLGEAGWSHAEPRKEIEEDGRSVTYTAMASGGYIRAGLRFTH